MDKEKFELLFKAQLLSDSAHMSKELNELFDSVLINEFNSVSPTMTSEAENRQAILELTDMFFGGR